MEQKKFNSFNKKKPSHIITLEQGKIPPQALDLEEAVLGGMMIDKRAVDDVIDILNYEVFYTQKHRDIYKAIENLFKKGEPIDLLTVSDELRTEGLLEAVGGDYYLVSLSQKVASSANIQMHARIVLQKYIQRKLIHISNEIIEEAYKDTTDVLDLLDTAETRLFEIAQNHLKKSTKEVSFLVTQAIKKIEDMSKKKGISGLATGFKDLDKLTSGWQPSDLIVIAGRPGMGKTAFIISMAKNMAIYNSYPVALFSLEMSSVQLITRMISIETGLESEKLRTGKLETYEWEQLNIKVNSLSHAPIFIDDTPALSIFDLRAKARRLKSQHDIKIIIIDYLQLMTTGNNIKAGNREQEIATISRNLKALAKELDIPVIALAQLSRAVETRGGNKRPLLSDLRESGAIEQDADIVSFIYRPEYYGITEWDDENATPCEGQAELIIAKHRNGGIGNIRLRFTGKFAKFCDINEQRPIGGIRPSTMNSLVGEGSVKEDAFEESSRDLPF